jgi:flagellar basal-body rod protein FlgF
VRGPGWIAVQDANGQEAYTRMGHLQISQNGIMQTTNGLNVLGDAGPVAVPPDQDMLIGKDGTVSTVPIGQNLNAVAIAGRIKLVNPPEVIWCAARMACFGRSRASRPRRMRM